MAFRARETAATYEVGFINRQTLFNQLRTMTTAKWLLERGIDLESGEMSILGIFECVCDKESRRSPDPHQ